MFGVYPRDELGFFENPATFLAITAGAAPVPLVPADPDRVILMLGAIVGAGITFGISTPSAAGGIFTLQLGASGPVTLSYDSHGPIVTYAWVISGTAGQQAGALSVQLSRDPQISGYSGIFEGRGEQGIFAPVKSFPPARKVVRRAPLPVGVRRLLARTCPKLYPGGE